MRITQSRNSCSRHGKILYNHDNSRINGDGLIIHLTEKHWLKKILSRHPDLGTAFDKVLETVERYDERKTLSGHKVKYSKNFDPHDLEVVVMNEHQEGNKYHIIHAMYVIGEIISFKKIDRRRL